MTKLDSILKSRAITLSTKVRLVKAMIFPVVMYACSEQQLEPDIKQLMCSKLGKEYIKTIYCHPSYLTSVQSTS